MREIESCLSDQNTAETEMDESWPISLKAFGYSGHQNRVIFYSAVIGLHRHKIDAWGLTGKSVSVRLPVSVIK